MNITARALYLYLFCILFSVPTQNFEILTFQEPLTVSFQKTSLALAALRDTQELEEEPDLAFNTLSSESLAEVKVAAIAPEHTEGSRLVVFEEGVTVSKDDILMVQKQMRKDQLLGAIAANLNAAQINRLMMAQDVDQILFEDWKQPSLDEEIKKFTWDNESPDVAVESNETPFNQLAIGLSNEKPVIIVSSGKILEPEKKSGPFLPANLIAKNDYVPPPEPPSPGFYDSIVPEMKSFAEPEPKSQILKGTFEFTGGMAFLFGQQNLEIVHEVDGVVQSKGFVNWSNAAFEIPVNILEGEIKAIVTDREGLIVGYGEIPLEGLPSDSYELSGFHIPLTPEYNGLNIYTISAYSFDDYIEKAKGVYVGDPLDKAIYKSDLDGHFENKLVKKGSTQNLQFRGKGNWTTTKYIESGEKSYVPIFEDSMVNALLETLGEQGYKQGLVGDHGIIWGKIRNFKNAEGVQVKITDSGAFGPSYLNHLYLPQRDLYATTKNGYFIFVGVKPGLHTLSFEYQGRSFDRTIETFRQNITYMDVALDTVVEQKIALLDMDQKPKDKIEVYIPGAKHKLAPSNPIKIKTIKSSTYNLLEFKPVNDDIIFRVNLSTNLRQANVRYMNEADLRGILNLDLISNAVIGFVEPTKFTGIFLNKKELSTGQMVYFDHSRKIIPNDQVGLRWQQIAGFAIYNLSEGSHSLQIFDENGYVIQHELLMGEKTIHLLSSD